MSYKFKQLQFILFYIGYIICLDKICEKKKVNLKVYDLNNKNETEFNNNYMRFLEENIETIYEPIRIHIDYTMLDKQTYLKPNFIKNLKSVFNKTAILLNNLLKVRPVKIKLKIDYCDSHILIDETIKQVGVDADLIIIPYHDKFMNFSTVIAYAYPCGIDKETFRPIIGAIGFTNVTDFEKLNSIDYYTMITLHEITHILSFNDELFPYFIKPDGSPLGIENILMNKIINGEKRTFIKTPRVVEKAKKHFNCDLIEGIELENDGMNGTVGNHWEARLMLGDLMMGVSYSDIFISDITLALFEDSGWYKVNYFSGGLFRFGKNSGCDFINTKCVKNEKITFGNEFCSNPRASICTSSRKSKGFCGLAKKKSEDFLQNQEDYFKNFKGNPMADNCPIATGFKQQFITSCQNGLSYYPKSLGENISEDSLCFMSSLKPKNFTILNYETNFAICYPVYCDYNNKTYNVTVFDKNVKCPKQGGSVALDGYLGVIFCPDFNLICTQSLGICNNSMECIEKRILADEPFYDYEYNNNMNFNNTLIVNKNNFDSIIIGSSLLPVNLLSSDYLFFDILIYIIVIIFIFI